MGIINKIIAAIIWNRALKKSKVGDLDGSIEEVAKISKYRKSSVLHDTLLATILLRQGKYDEALVKFSEVEQKTREFSNNINNEYLNIYSKVYLEEMSDESADCVNLISRANSLNCSPSLKRWFPLSEVAPPGG